MYNPIILNNPFHPTSTPSQIEVRDTVLYVTAKDTSLAAFEYKVLIPPTHSIKPVIKKDGHIEINFQLDVNHVAPTLMSVVYLDHEDFLNVVSGKSTYIEVPVQALKRPYTNQEGYVRVYDASRVFNFSYTIYTEQNGVIGGMQIFGVNRVYATIHAIAIEDVKTKAGKLIYPKGSYLHLKTRYELRKLLNDLYEPSAKVSVKNAVDGSYRKVCRQSLEVHAINTLEAFY